MTDADKAGVALSDCDEELFETVIERITTFGRPSPTLRGASPEASLDVGRGWTAVIAQLDAS